MNKSNVSTLHLWVQKVPKFLTCCQWHRLGSLEILLLFSSLCSAIQPVLESQKTFQCSERKRMYNYHFPRHSFNPAHTPTHTGVWFNSSQGVIRSLPGPSGSCLATPNCTHPLSSNRQPSSRLLLNESPKYFKGGTQRLKIQTEDLGIKGQLTLQDSSIFPSPQKKVKLPPVLLSSTEPGEGNEGSWTGRKNFILAQDELWYSLFCCRGGAPKMWCEKKGKNPWRNKRSLNSLRWDTSVFIQK